MKKTTLVTVAIVAMTLVTSGFVCYRLWQSDEASVGTYESGDEQEKFRLSDPREEPGEMVEISAKQFAEMVEAKKSFVVILHMEICPAEFPITSVAKQLAHEEGLKLYALKEDEYAKTALAEKVKYLPSAAIYHDGKLVEYLDAEEDADVPYYKSTEGLKTWIRKWVEY